MRESEGALLTELGTAQDAVLGACEQHLEALKAEHETLRQQYMRQMEGYGERVRAVW